MVLIMVVVVFVTLVNLFIKFNCKDLFTITSVKLHVARSAIVFSGLLCGITFFEGIAMLNSILL